MHPTHPLSACYESDPESSEPALTPPASDTNTERSKPAEPNEENSAISDKGWLCAMFPQDVAAFATEVSANAGVDRLQTFDSQTDPVYGLVHAIHYINQRLPELNITEKDRLQHLMSDKYAQYGEVRDTNTATSSGSIAPDVAINQHRHKSGNMIRLKRSMIKKVEPGMPVKHRQVPGSISRAHPPPVNHRGVVRDHNQGSEEGSVTANGSIDFDSTFSSCFAPTSNPEDEDKPAGASLKNKPEGPELSIRADTVMASRSHLEKDQEEDNQLLDQILLPFKAIAMSSQGIQLHSVPEEKTLEQVDWIDKAVHGNPPKLNTLEQVRAQMQHRNGHASDVGQYPTMGRTISFIPGQDDEEVMGSGEDQACKFCGNWGCDYCKPDWFDSLLQEQDESSDTGGGWEISDSDSEHHQHVHAGGALRDLYPDDKGFTDIGAATDQHERCATLTGNASVDRLDIGNAFCPVRNDFDHVGSHFRPSSSEVEQNVPESHPRSTTPDVVRGYNPNPRGDDAECWNNGTGVNEDSGSISDGGCWDTTSGDVHSYSGDPSTTFSTIHESAPSVTGFSDAGKSNKTNSNPTNEESPASIPYTVTYWATVECGDQITHIPVNSDNVTGPEKILLDGPGRKVWKWVQERGLDDKISLQDVYDLAKDIQGPSHEHYAEDQENGDGSIRVRSRASSSVTICGGWGAPRSLRHQGTTEAARNPHFASGSVNWVTGRDSRGEWSA